MDEYIFEHDYMRGTILTLYQAPNIFSIIEAHSQK